MFKYILIYFAIVNIIGALVNCIDKIKAKNSAWRIPEATLWSLGIIGGALGSYIAMKTIRHKTKHKSFMIGMPILIVIQIALLIYIFIKIKGLI